MDSDVVVGNCPHQKFVDKHVCFDCRSTSDALSFSLEVQLFNFVQYLLFHYFWLHSYTQFISYSIYSRVSQPRGRKRYKNIDLIVRTGRIS